MKLALVGVGAVGSRMVDRILEVEADTGRAFTRGNALVCDIARTPADGFDAVPEDQRVLLGDTHEDVTAEGVEGDLELAADVAGTDLPEFRRALDSLAIHESDGVLVVADLGSATGSGAGAVLVEELQGLYDEPLYVLGALPADDDGGVAALNAARALRSVVPTADSTLAFDRETWPGDPESDDDPEIRALATRVATLFAAGELDSDAVAENAMDSSDLIRTLEPGGIASVGYASTDVEPDERGLFARLVAWFSRGGDDGDEATDAAKVKSLVQRAANTRLTVPCEVSSAERALVVLSGPPSELSRRGFESARQWLEAEADTVEILAGDDPRPRSSTLEAVVIFSNVTDVPRIDALQQRALDTQAAREGGRASDSDAVESRDHDSATDAAPSEAGDEGDGGDGGDAADADAADADAADADAADADAADAGTADDVPLIQDAEAVADDGSE
ncbi:cell division GTPase FtsZ [Halarchaeum rubridurum]|uniref:Tubulin-like protein CetZ n=1 Tax=Halarchaeum rubridurum TaxID=489911 RepID=A0A830FQ27_9EURY|nr:tubulin/FtsZ family protein [Halarchaeum rubridurum]MBP1954777.1 cell division GTPase FtsZ [Halarchaeum rubridurum]GGM59679.1 cell division protein [Halarchaeum rubridurum]